MLLNDDELANLEKQGPGNGTAKKAGRKPGETSDETSRAVQDLWAEEGDDFFGQSGQAPSASITEVADDEDGTPGPQVVTGRGRGRKGGLTRGNRGGRGRGRGKKSGRDSMADDF